MPFTLSLSNTWRLNKSTKNCPSMALQPLVEHGKGNCLWKRREGGSNEEKQTVLIPSGSVVTWKTGPIRVPEILSNDEIQVFKNLIPPVPEELLLFNIFKKVLVTSVQNFFNIWQDHFKDFRNFKISLKWWNNKEKFCD